MSPFTEYESFFYHSYYNMVIHYLCNRYQKYRNNTKYTSISVNASNKLFYRIKSIISFMILFLSKDYES